MKNLILLLILSCALTVHGQTSDEHLENGINKHQEQNFKGAVKDYTKAIKADKKNKTAYFNRGTCLLALENLKGAVADFNTTIKLDPKYTQAYFQKATIFILQEDYLKALPELDKTIELNPEFPQALTVRGQIRAQTGNEEGACEDFNLAKEYGVEMADVYLQKFCGGKGPISEILKLEWPKDEKWGIGSEQENEQMTMHEMIKSGETLESWTEIGTMIKIKGAKNIPMDKVMNLTFEQAKEIAPKAKLTFIEKDESVEYPWIIFTIESPSHKNDKNPESQLYYVVQGKTALFTNLRAVREATLPAELKEKWAKFFKTAEIISE